VPLWGKETGRKETILFVPDEAKCGQNVNPWNIMLKNLLIFYLVKKFPSLLMNI
jgi:hypothetical protein